MWVTIKYLFQPNYMILDNSFSDRSTSVDNGDMILDIIGNNTRRRILATLAREPMYFNQLAKEIAIGQQAILRHMKTLEDMGLIESYGEKSNLGAPDRKYYRLSSSFSLTICLSEDAFSIENRKIEQYRHKESDKFYKEYDLLAQDNDGKTLNQLQNNLIRIEKEISNLDSRLNDLRALKQLIVNRLHKIAKDNFEEELERRILHTIIGESPKSVSELANRLSEKPSRIRNTLNEMNKKIYRSDHKHTTIFLGIRET
jgi:ArsR family transcriptional regulator